MDYLIPVYHPSLDGNEKKYVTECLESTWISSKGGFINRFEKAFSDYVGVEHSTSVSNGTVALHLALEAIGINEGDEIIVPSLTYIASVNTIIQSGAIPVFVDSIEATWQIDPSDVLKKITPKTKAIMVVHLYGLACDMDELVSICQFHNLKLIEDCAEAFGTKYKNRHVGCFGDIATFSFFGNKTITTGEGGMVVSKSLETIEKARHLKSQGVSKVKEYWHDVLAYNYRMTNICAAIGLAQIERADQILAKKRAIAELYKNNLVDLPLVLHGEKANFVHSYWMCSLLLEDPALRDPLRNALKNKGIETRPVFFPAHTMPHCKVNASFPIAESISSRGINLPSFPGMTEEQVLYVCHSISDFLHEKA